MGPRNIVKCDKCSKNHKGTDYRTPCGTALQPPPSFCKKIGGPTSTPDHENGYGNVAQYDCGNGIKLQYAHLQGPNAVSGNGQITTGTSGNSTGCHLDYTVYIDGKVVDAQCATGVVSGNYHYGGSSTQHGIACPVSGQPDLCDPDTRQKLKDHSSQVFSGNNDGQLSTPNGGTSDEVHGVDTTPPISINLGTQDGGQGSGSGSGSGGDDPLDIPQPNPEEEEKEKPRPSEEYKGQATKPICDNSTCILQDMIDTAKNQHVQYDKAKDYYEYITHEGECKEPTKTNVTVFRQAEGETKKYPDAFCSNQGCAYKNDGGGGDGKCE